jgi:hypothetical protein
MAGKHVIDGPQGLKALEGKPLGWRVSPSRPARRRCSTGS